MKAFLTKNVQAAIAIVLWIAVGAVGTLGLGALSASDAEARSFSSRSSSSASRSYSRPAAVAPKPVRVAPKPKVVQTKVIKQTTVINRNTGPAYGGGYGGYNSGSGVGSSILGGVAGGIGGAMLYDAMTDDEGLTQEQVDAKVQEALKAQEVERQAAELQSQIEALQLQQQKLLGAPAAAVEAVTP